jgi:hypothetical protein
MAMRPGVADITLAGSERALRTGLLRTDWADDELRMGMGAR